MTRDAVQRRRTGMAGAVLLGALDLFPLCPDRVHRPGLRIAKNMGMPANQLFRDVSRDLIEIERATFLRQLTVKHDLQQQIAEFFLHFMVVTSFNGVYQLVHLLDRMPANGAMVLLAVPGASRR